MPSSIVAALVLLLLLGTPQVAEALTCSRGPRRVSPSAGSTEMPTNVRPRFLYASGFEGTVELFRDDEPVEVTWQVASGAGPGFDAYVVVQPAAELAPRE